MNRSKKWVPQRLLLLMLAVSVAAVPLACGNIDVAGKYVSENDPKSYLELKSDRTFFVQ